MADASHRPRQPQQAHTSARAWRAGARLRHVTRKAAARRGSAGGRPPGGVEAENGDIVAAMIDGEATVKTLRQADGQVWLMPHNPAYTPVPAKDAVILGRVVTVLRRL